MMLSVKYGSNFSDNLPNVPGYEPEGADEQLWRSRYEFQRTANPSTGMIPSNIHERELAFVASLPTQRSSSLWLSKPTDTDTTLRLGSEWMNHAIEKTGGRTRALALDAGNENIILAGGVGGGMWRSTDAGSSWRPTTSSNALHSVSCLAQDTRSSKRNVWYYGTGELFSTGGYPLYQHDIGDGIFKSNDGGQSWVHLSSTVQGRADRALSPFHFVHSLTVDHTRNDSDVVYAACYGGIMRSNDGGNSWKMVLGSSDVSSSTTSRWSDVTITKNGVLYAALSYENSATGGVWRSTNGMSWQRISTSSLGTFYSRIRLAAAPSNPNVIWAMVSGSSVAIWKYTYLSGNGSSSGGSWENRSQGRTVINSLNTYGTYCLLLAVSPTDEDVVITGATDLYYTDDGFQTTGSIIHVGGYSDEYIATKTWNPVKPELYLYGNHHPDLHTAIFLPSNPKVVLTGCDGGIFRTNNINQRPTTQWESLNEGYNAAQFYSVAIDPTGNRDGIIVGGAQDNNSSVGSRDGKAMRWILGGDGMICDMAGGHRSFYPAYQGGQVYRVVMNDALNTITNYNCVRPSGSAYFDFIAPLRLDPNDDKVLFMIGNTDIWRNSNIENIPLNQSTNSTSQGWTKISASSYTSGSTLSAFGISRTPKNRLYVGTRMGGLLRVDNVQQGTSASIRQLSSSLFPSGAFVNCITVDPNDGDNVFVVFSNYGVRSLFHSTNGGTSWEEISGNLEESPDGSGAGPACRCIDVLHYQHQTLYMVGTTAGLFTTTKLEGNNTVWKFVEAIGNVNVNMIRSRSTDGFVAIATHGLGIFTTYVHANNDTNSVKETPSAILHPVYPNPCDAQAFFHFTTAQDAELRLSIYDVAGRFVTNVYSGFLRLGEHSQPFDTRALAPGQYFCHLDISGQRYSQVLTVVR